MIIFITFFVSTFTEKDHQEQNTTALVASRPTNLIVTDRTKQPEREKLRQKWKFPKPKRSPFAAAVKPATLRFAMAHTANNKYFAKKLN